MTNFYGYLCQLADNFWENVIAAYLMPEPDRCPMCEDTDSYDGDGFCERCTIV